MDNTMFVMTRDEILQTLVAGPKFTYANRVVDYCPQEDDPNRIRITTGGGILINYDSNSLVHTAYIDTAKLHWNTLSET